MHIEISNITYWYWQEQNMAEKEQEPTENQVHWPRCLHLSIELDTKTIYSTMHSELHLQFRFTKKGQIYTTQIQTLNMSSSQFQKLYELDIQIKHPLSLTAS